jgi:hypothetical protein
MIGDPMLHLLKTGKELDAVSLWRFFTINELDRISSEKKSGKVSFKDRKRSDYGRLHARRSLSRTHPMVMRIFDQFGVRER